MRFRLIATATREYEVNSADYLTPTATAMLALDKKAITDDPMIMIDHPDTIWDIKVEQVS